MEMNTNLPKNIIENAAKAANNLLPEKSRLIYDKNNEIFNQWKLKNKIIAIDDTVLLAYFQELRYKIGLCCSTVYLCAKKHNKQKLVMKELKTNLQGDDLKAAKNEISILKSLRHPNVILYYDSYSKKNVFFIMMEYATNGTLHEYLYNRKKNLSPQKVINYFCQILMGLDHIHEKKVIHRDLKCENIFLTGRKAEVIKIGDFGISTLTLKYKGDIDDLKERIRQEIRLISPEVIENVQWETLYRIQKCLEVNGQHIEHQ